jgi:hypothetical protein
MAPPLRPLGSLSLDDLVLLLSDNGYEHASWTHDDDVFSDDPSESSSEHHKDRWYYAYRRKSSKRPQRICICPALISPEYDLSLIFRATAKINADRSLSNWELREFIFQRIREPIDHWATGLEDLPALLMNWGSSFAPDLSESLAEGLSD